MQCLLFICLSFILFASRIYKTNKGKQDKGGQVIQPVAFQLAVLNIVNKNNRRSYFCKKVSPYQNIAVSLQTHTNTVLFFVYYGLFHYALLALRTLSTPVYGRDELKCVCVTTAQKDHGLLEIETRFISGLIKRLDMPAIVNRVILKHHHPTQTEKMAAKITNSRQPFRVIHVHAFFIHFTRLTSHHCHHGCPTCLFWSDSLNHDAETCEIQGLHDLIVTCLPTT
ncbi:hypothetical protein CEXT_782231 [Caerostris extrusa]|uniref:Secreted protein n=1 Tax=Caerostris extrusa TaxID=172846 RepID=A0AAV4SQA6_CAEEX|nr:hypothetical protein CEXT_782231 [Caerostris extrusa]